MDSYFRLMGCLTWTIAIIASVIQVVHIVKHTRFQESKEAFVNFLNLLAIVILGSGLGFLFMDYGKSMVA